uniref:Uncharacterized protein n=1 Tax=Glossina brevipalpis TaxID=37001 RepID=A0A1A9X382_9MUSC
MSFACNVVNDGGGGGGVAVTIGDNLSLLFSFKNIVDAIPLGCLRHCQESPCVYQIRRKSPFIEETTNRFCNIAVIVYGTSQSSQLLESSCTILKSAFHILSLIHYDFWTVSEIFNDTKTFK